MKQRFGRLAFSLLYAFIFLLLVFEVGCSSSLSRSQVENLIKGYGIEVLGDPISYNVPLRLDLYDVVATEDEVNRRVPLTYGSSLKGRFLEGKFVDILEKAGILTPVSVENATSRLQPGRQILVLKYVCASGEDIKFNKNDSGYDTADLILGSPQLSRITGIIQNEQGAHVDAEITFVPTKMYTQVKKFVSQLESQEGNSAANYLDVQWLENIKKSMFFIDRELTSTRKRQFRFTKYDDGWRLSKAL